MPPETSRRIGRELRSYARGRVAELARPATRAASEPLALWAQRRIRLDGKPFTFAGHEYLRALYDDTAPHIVLCKAAQIGGTVWAILRSLHACIGGLDVIYYFPTRTDVLEFSKSRVGPLLAQNPFLAKQMTDTDTAGLKRIGQAHLYLRGMQSTVGMKSVPADMLVFDELDEASPDAKALAKERLAHSDYKRVLELSNPSLPGYGIDEIYELSDQRHWTLRCPGCGHWCCLDREFPVTLGQEVRVLRERPDGTVYRACPRCECELESACGEWVADYPDRSIHGYRISQLFSEKVDPAEILYAYRTTRFPERFYNLKIGIPWADTQNRLSLSDVWACSGDAGLSEGCSDRCTMGVDTGKDLHVVIGRVPAYGAPREIIYLGIHREYAELDELIRRFSVRTCVIDALPEIHVTRALASRQRGTVWLNYFNENQRGQPRWDVEQHIVQENRTEVLDLSRTAIRRREVVLPRRLPIVEEFALHLTHDAKRLVEDEETGAQAYRYLRTGVDHFSLAFTYECLAALREVGSGPSAGASSPPCPEFRGVVAGDMFPRARRTPLRGLLFGRVE